jgi:hypothetical protein
MAVFRVVNNYYTDILDTINVSVIKHGNDFEAGWNALNKMALVKKLGSTMVKLERVQDTDVHYWQSQLRTYKFYMAILITILICIFISYGFFFYLNYNRWRDEKIKFEELSRIGIVYVMILMVIFSVFFLIIFNLSFSCKQFKAQIIKNQEDDFPRFQNLLLNTPNGQVLNMALKYIGYIEKGSYEHAQQILNGMKKNIKNMKKNRDKSPGEDDGPCDASSVIDFDSLNTYYCTLSQINSATINQASSSPLLINDIHDCLKTFYDNGNGYYILKLNVVASSNIFTLREFRRIMNYYYFLTLKKSSNQNTKIVEENQKKIIYAIIIKPVKDKTIPEFMSNQNLEIITIDEIAKKIAPYDFELTKFSEYINTELSSSLGSSPSKEQIQFISDFTKRVIAEVYNKQQSSLKNIVGNVPGSKFYTPDEFLVNLNDMSYQDFMEGLEIKYLQEAMTMFYDRISSSKDNNSLDDLNYEGNRSTTLYMYFMSFSIASIVLGWVYYTFFTWNGERVEMDKRHTEELQGQQDEEVIGKVGVRHKKEWVNLIIKLAIPTAAIFFIICLIFSAYLKKRDTFSYNQEIIEANTSDFKSSINDLYQKINDLNGKVSQPLNHISTIDSIQDDDKFEIFSLLKVMVDKFEKCNYVLEAAKNKFPFPYSEVTVDLFMIGTLLAGVVYITSSFKPGEKWEQLKEWKELLNALENGSAVQDLPKAEKAKREAACHDKDIEGIVFTLKVVFFIFIFMFLLFYSSKLLASSAEFKHGIYNSNYYDKSQCYDE